MITTSDFQPAWWLWNSHLQTIWPTLFRPRPHVTLRSERVELDDGDFLDLACTEEQSGPLVLFIHGLEGNLRSHYSTGMLRALHTAGLQTVFMHLRGCSPEPNRLPRRYHSGETGDPMQVITYLKGRYPQRPIYAIGISAGGNILMKLLGEHGAHCGVERAMAISVPFDLGRTCETLRRGFARVYQHHLLSKLKHHLREKPDTGNVPFSRVMGLASQDLIAFDNTVTAPMFGFRDAAEYYQKSSSRQYLRTITVPTLLLHALDDPFMTPDTLPREEELSASVRLELSPHGGHVGFISGNNPLHPIYWLEQRAVKFFTCGD